MGMIVPAFIVLGCALLAAHLRVSSQFRARVREYTMGLSQSDVSEAGRDPESLPPLVQAFARRAIASADSRPRVIRMWQQGEMRQSADGKWMPFHAIHDAAVRRPGFVWNARARIPPLAGVSVIDAYANSQGHLEARLLGSIPLAKAEGPAVARGQLMRYLSEIVWYPDAIFCNSEVQWLQLDERTVEISSGEGTQRATARLLFDEHGDIVRIVVPDRPRLVKNQTINTPWTATVSDYALLSGYRVPTRGVVSWEPPEGPYAYWRASVVDLKPVQ